MTTPTNLHPVRTSELGQAEYLDILAWMREHNILAQSIIIQSSEGGRERFKMSWNFYHPNDAMLFKLRWGGNV